MKILSASAIALGLVSSVAAFAPVADNHSSPTQLSETKKDLQNIATELNPVLKYWDPLGLSTSAPWGYTDEASIGWFRHAEIKHGRVAMAAFVGYWVQSNYHWPWSMTLEGTPFPGVDLSPPEQWDVLPFASKLQIVLFVGFLEWYSELTPGDGSDVGQTHYTKGGQPGKYPDFQGGIPHPVPYNLFDPFRYSKNATEEEKARGLLVEINNGRLAMLGIFGFLCEQTIPGSVPALTDVVKPYAGQVMAPFASDFSIFG